MASLIDKLIDSASNRVVEPRQVKESYTHYQSPNSGLENEFTTVFKVVVLIVVRVSKYSGGM